MIELESAIVYTLFLASNIATGVCLYRLGLHGQVRRMMKQMDEPSVDKTSRAIKEPSAIPGAEFNPVLGNVSGYEQYRYTAEEDEDDDDDSFVEDPVNPYRGDDDDAEEPK